MKEQEHPLWKVWITGVAFIGVFFILAGLIWIMYHYTQPPPPDTAYWAERTRNLSELRAQNQDQLNNYGWIDADRGVVRLPVARAMELSLQEWQNPESGRSNLLYRAEKMAPPVPVVAVVPAGAKTTNAPASVNTPANTNTPAITNAPATLKPK